MCMRTVDVAAVRRIPSGHQKALWTSILLALCNIFHHYFSSTCTCYSDFLSTGMTIFHRLWQYGNSRRTKRIWNKGKKKHNETDFFFSLLRFISLHWFDAFSPSGCILTSMMLLAGLCFPVSYTKVLIIPTNMTDNRCNVPAFHQKNTATFSATSICKREKQCSGVTNRVIKHIEMLTPHQM